jgi:hypothetical protein
MTFLLRDMMESQSDQSNENSSTVHDVADVKEEKSDSQSESTEPIENENNKSEPEKVIVAPTAFRPARLVRSEEFTPNVRDVHDNGRTLSVYDHAYLPPYAPHVPYPPHDPYVPPPPHLYSHSHYTYPTVYLPPSYVPPQHYGEQNPYYETPYVPPPNAEPYYLQPANVRREVKKIERGIKKTKSRTNRRPRTLPDEATRILKQWYDAHYDNPYPTYEDKQEMMKLTGLNFMQVNTWFINKRCRDKDRTAEDQ